VDDIEKYIVKEKIEIPEELLYNPLKYITNYYESIFLNVGKSVFYILSLVPCSLIIPEITTRRRKIKQKINFILISNPATGKTSIAEEFEKISYNPIFVEHITRARMVNEMKQKEFLTLIISDIANSFNNEDLVKFLEQILGDEGVISVSTMHNKGEKTRKRKNAVAYLAGTPENITKEVLKWGLLSRMSPLLIVHSPKEHDEIIDFISDEIGEEYKEKENCIPLFYKELLKIQNGEHYIPKIEGYIFPKEIKEEIKKYLKPLVSRSFEKWGVNATREVQESYRFMISHAFLNIFKKYRDGLIKNNKLIIDKKDLKVAKFLIKREILTKEFIMDCINQLNYNNIKTIQKLKEWAYKHKIKENNPKVRLMEGMMRK